MSAFDAYLDHDERIVRTVWTGLRPACNMLIWLGISIAVAVGVIVAGNQLAQLGMIGSILGYGLLFVPVMLVLPTLMELVRVFDRYAITNQRVLFRNLTRMDEVALVDIRAVDVALWIFGGGVLTLRRSNGHTFTIYGVADPAGVRRCILNAQQSMTALELA